MKKVPCGQNNHHVNLVVAKECLVFIRPLNKLNISGMEEGHNNDHDEFFLTAMGFKTIGHVFFLVAESFAGQ